MNTRSSGSKSSSTASAVSASSKGAVQSKTSISDRFRSYRLHHRTSLIESFFRLVSTPVQTMMTALVVAIALALPVTLLLAMDNINTLGATWDSNPKISVYLNVRAKQKAIDQLLTTIHGYSEVDAVDYFSPDDALRDFQMFSGFGAALDALEQNPLPPTVVISPNMDTVDPNHLETLAERIKAEPIVEDVSLDMDWVRRLQEIMILGQKMVLALATLLGVGVLLAIGNTIRLAIESRRDEILVAKLVGGTDGFVRRPFLYSGGWYGLFGGVLACIIVIIGYSIIEPSVVRLASLYQSEFALRGLGFSTGFQLLFLSTVLGWLGSWFAVGRHLSHIEPK
ncbi:MAG: permease-like cell division protein FtsX [Agarilytica sp.]